MGPVVDKASGDEEIVLTVVLGVSELRAEPFNLKGTYIEVALERDIDTAAKARGESVVAIGNTSFTAAGVSRSDQELREWLGTVSAFDPRLRDAIANACEE